MTQSFQGCHSRPKKSQSVCHQMRRKSCWTTKPERILPSETTLEVFKMNSQDILTEKLAEKSPDFFPPGAILVPLWPILRPMVARVLQKTVLRCQTWLQIGSDWPQIGQIRRFLYTESDMKKIPGFLPFVANVAHFGPKTDESEASSTLTAARPAFHPHSPLLKPRYTALRFKSIN